MNSNEICEVIDQLEELIQAETFSLVANDMTRFDVPRSALLRCFYFENYLNQHQDATQLMVDASSIALRIFEAFVNDEEMQEDIGDIFDAMAFAGNIKCQKFARYCAHHAGGVRVPQGSLPAVIDSVLQQLVKFLPVRTFDQYRDVLKTFTDNDSNANQRIRAIVDVLTYDPIYDNLPLPLPLFQKRVTAALMEDIQGHMGTAILVDRKWVPANIFGPDFCPVMAHVKNFHLCFNKYVLYQTLDGSIMLKNLLTNDADERLFHTSKFFRSRRNQLHVIRQDEETGRDILYEWDDEEVDFVKKFSNPRFKLKTAHRDRNDRLVVVLENGSVLRFADKDCMLPEYEQREAVTDTVDGWTMTEDGVSMKRIQVNGESVHAQLMAPTQIGYNIVGMRRLGDDMYESIIYEKSGTGYVCSLSPMHGKVLCLSDVLVL